MYLFYTITITSHGACFKSTQRYNVMFMFNSKCATLHVVRLHLWTVSTLHFAQRRISILKEEHRGEDLVDNVLSHSIDVVASCPAGDGAAKLYFHLVS